MNTLRILSLVCGTSRVKYPIGLLTLFLLWPALASADCSPAQPSCLITSGSAVIDPNAPCSYGFGPCAPFNFAGRNFSASGVIIDLSGFNLPFDPDLFIAGGSFPLLFSGGPFELTLNGVPWGNIDTGEGTWVFFSAILDLCCVGFGSGGNQSPFSFEGGFTGAPEPFSPGLGCDVLNCVTLEFRGSGIVTYDVGDNGAAMGPLIFTFAAVPAVPEPATLSLFALGLVGVGFMGRRRKN